jgi:hypothetical protein
LIQNQPRYEGRPIEAQPAVTQNAMVLPDERCAEGRDGIQFGEIRQVCVEDWEIDIEQMIRRGRNAVIKSTVEIDNGIDVVAIQNLPVRDRRRDEKKSLVVHLKQFHSIPRLSFLNPSAWGANRETRPDWSHSTGASSHFCRACWTISTSTVLASLALVTSRRNAIRAPRIPS